MNKTLKTILTCSLLMLSAVACNSGRTSDNQDNADADSIFSVDGGGIFIANDGSTGTIDLNLTSTSIPVADTAGFSVSVRGANGAGTSNVSVDCQSEAPLAIIEPSTLSFITDGFGDASGVIGCEDSGSVQLACQVSGTGQSVFATVICTGDRPIGFDGFGNDADGGLGNGVIPVADDDADDSAFIVRVVDLALNENGAPTTSVDISQDSDCTTDDDVLDSEPFTDTSVTFTIDNNTEQIVRFTEYSYTVENFDGTGANFTSGTLNLIGESLGVGQQGTFDGLFADAGAGGQKFFFGLSTPITSAGFRNITYNLSGTISDGTALRITASEAASFDDFDNCP